MNQQRDLIKIYRTLAKQYNMDIQDIMRICNSPFKFTIERMIDEDPKDILFANLFRFKMKKRFKDGDRTFLSRSGN